MARRVNEDAERFAAQPAAGGGRPLLGIQPGEFFDGVAERWLAIARRRRPADEKQAEADHPSAFNRRSTPAAMPANAW